MISYRHPFRAPSFRWLFIWALLLTFGVGGPAYAQCPPGGEPPPIAGLGAGPGSADRTFGYTGGPNFNTLQPSMADLLEKIGNIIPAPGEIRAIAVQSTNKFIIAGNFTYQDPGSGKVYRNIMRLNPNGSVDATFQPTFFPGPINALAIQSTDNIIVGGEFIILGPPNRSRLLRLNPNGVLDPTFNTPTLTAAVLALEVDPSDNIYVGLNGGTIVGTIGVPPRQNFTRLLANGTPDTSLSWEVIPPSPLFQTGVNGPVRAIKYAPNLFGSGFPGIIVGGSFTQATGGVFSLSVGNIAMFDTSGGVDFLFSTSGPGANGPVNALAVQVNLFGDLVFAGGEFTQFNSANLPRVAKFTSGGLDPAFSPPGGVVPNPVRALALTTASNLAPPPFNLLWVGGQETASAFAEVALDPSSGGTAVLGSITSPFFPANPAVVRAIAANNIGALFGGEFLTDDAQKLVATFNPNYNPPISTGLPSFVGVGPTQFYTSALLPNGDLLVGGDVGIPSTGGATPDGGHVVELYRITPCGTVTTVAQFRNVGGYLVRNDIDNGNLVLPPEDINTTPNPVGYRRVDVVDPPSIRAIATDPQGRIYVGGQFNQVGEGTSQNFIPWNNLVRLTGTGTIDATFQVGNIDPNPLPGYTVIRKGGPTGFGAPGTGFSTVDPKEIAEGTSGFCSAPPNLPLPGIGEKFDPNDGRVNAIVIQPDGKVLIGGEFKCYNEVPRSGIARLTSTGSLDQTFGDSSFSLPGVGDYQQCGNPVANSGLRNASNTKYERARVNAILLETDGKVTVAGLFARANNVDRYNIARFNSDGTLDTSFATGPTGSIFPTGTSGLPSVGGAASNGRGGEIFALARQNLGPNAGRLLIGGAFNRILNPTGAAGFNLRTAFTRFQSDGRHDTTFAQLPFAQPPLTPLPPIVRAIAVKSDDRPIIGGPFLIGPRNIVNLPPDGIGYINNTTRARVHRTGVNGTFTDDVDPFGVPRATWLAVPPGVGQNPNAPLVFQPGPYALPVGSLASVFPSLTEISYYPNLPFNSTPQFVDPDFLDARMTVNTIALDPSRQRAYIAGLFNAFESVRADFQNDSAGAPNGLGLNILWPAVAALQNGSGCSYGLVLPSFPPFQPIPAGTTVNLPAMNPAGGQMVIASMTRSAVSLCNLTPTITTNSAFVTIVGAVPRSTNPGFVDIVVNVSPNATGALRNGSVTVTLPSETGTSPAPVTFNFSQGPASGCVYTAVSVPSSFPISGGAGQFQITTGTGCAWTITGLPTWVSASPTSGSGSATVNFTVAANSGAPRSATVNVAGQTITLTQNGTCTLTLGAPTGTSQPVTGGTGSFTVTTSAGCTYTATSSAPWLVITSGATGGPTGTVVFQMGRNSGAARTATITVTAPGAAPQSVTVSQAPDSGADTVGMFRPSNGFFYLRFTNTSGNADTDFFYGLANDIPLSGDWNGDGVTTVGVFRNGQFLLRNSNTAGFADVAAFSITGTQPGDIPLAGDWNGNGVTTVGLFRAGVFLLRNSNTSGPADMIINYALPTDMPIVGDWDGDGVTTIGLFRANVAFFALRNSNSSGAPDVQFFFGNPNDTPVAGDWNGNGVTTIGVFRTGTFFLRNTNSAGAADLTVSYGVSTDRPVIGKWQ